MSAGSSRPPVPRPSPRSAPPPDSKPPSSPVIEIPRAYQSSPPVIRDRAPSSSLELSDDDVVEEPAKRPATPPPAPPLAKKKTLTPPKQEFVVPAPISKAQPRIAPLPLPLPRFEPAPPVALAPPPVTDIEPPPSIEPPPESRVELKPIAKRIESTLDPMDVLFDGVYEMNFVDSAAEAASVCATALAKALRARAVIIHAHDLVKRELRAIGAFGAAEDVVGLRSRSEDDLIASAVFCNEKPVTMRFEGELPYLAPPRLNLVGAPRTLVAVPAIAWGRCVAMIEVIDADDRVAERVADSTAYVAERLAEFLSERAAA